LGCLRVYKMSNLDKFSLFTGIIGLIADSITLIGLASLFTIPTPQLGFWSKPEIVALWTFSLMVYGLIVCQFFIIQYARTRWERMRKLPSIKSRKKCFFGFGLFVVATNEHHLGDCHDKSIQKYISIACK